MSTLYPDLSLTTFPSEGVDTFTTWINIVASDGPLILQYKNAIQAGNTTLANQILAQIPSATQKIIRATDLNKLSESILATERFYLTDVQPYIAERQAEWEAFINQFIYKGEYNGGTTYERNNIVSYVVAGLTYLFIATSDPPSGTVPTNTSYWRQLTIRGQQGVSGEGLSYRGYWLNSNVYTPNTAVTYDGGLWMSLQDSRGIVPGSNDQYWRLIMSLDAVSYPIQPEPPTAQEQGGIWFNTNEDSTQYYWLEPLSNPAGASNIQSGYQAYDAQGNLITGTRS